MRTPIFVFRARRWLRRHARISVIPIGLIAIAAAGLFVLAGPDLPPAAVEIVTPAPDVKLPISDAAKIGSRMEAAVAAQGGDLSALSAFAVPPPLYSVDGTSFRRGEDAVRLWGVEGPKEEDVCLDGDGRRWSCGLQARAALHNTVAGRGVECQPRARAPAGELLASCRVPDAEGRQGGDLAALLVSQGWARPDVEGQALYAIEADNARQRQAGLWRGGWKIAPAAQ